MANAEQATKKTYRGNCHCGAFVFELEISEIKSVMICNCSVCIKKSYIWVFPGAEPTVIKDEGSLVEYSFGDKKMVHKSCGKCGTAVLSTSSAYPPPMNVAVNVSITFMVSSAKTSIAK